MICNKLEDCCDVALTGKIIDGCPKLASCIVSRDNRPIVSCQEKNRQYSLKNTLENIVAHYRVDDGIITGTDSLKCDRLFVIGGDVRIGVLVELKGNDVAQGIRQITATMEQIPRLLNTCSRVHARIVATKAVPNLMATSRVTKLKAKLRAMHGTLEVRTRQYTEQDSRLL